MASPRHFRSMQPIDPVPMPGPSPRRAVAPARRLLTPLIWLLTIAVLLVGGLLASLFVMMPVSLDVGETVAAGVDPWRDAVLAATSYGLLFAAGAVALLLWHRGPRGSRLAAGLAWAIAGAAAAAVGWGGAVVMHDWF